jgi:tRNA-Thr(GGU) m(6)t(6)A37 methyltransferase TsaA
MAADARPGEVALPFDPADRTEAGVTFIGRARTPWGPGRCPKNLTEARAEGGPFLLEIDEAYRPGLTGLVPGDALVILLWFAQARRDLILQAPRHRPEPRGTFALRSPVRPNPIGLEIVHILTLDPDAGRIAVDALDAFDSTPILDIKPWIAAIDIPGGA